MRGRKAGHGRGHVDWSSSCEHGLAAVASSTLNRRDGGPMNLRFALMAGPFPRSRFRGIEIIPGCLDDHCRGVHGIAPDRLRNPATANPNSVGCVWKGKCPAFWMTWNCAVGKART